MERIAIVTGGNKGIGFAICKQLAAIPNTRVILTARDENRGLQAVKAIGKTNIEFHQLDLDDKQSSARLATFLRDKYSGLDILVNNAAIAFKGDAFNEDVARATIGTNYFGTLQVLEDLLPIMRQGGRVVNVTSMSGTLSKVSKKLQSEFTDPNLTVDNLSALMRKFIDDVAADRYQSEGWPRQTYAVSKIGVTALTRVLARDFQHKGILINCMCPGWVRTDMSGLNSGAPREPEDAAPLAAWLSTLPADSKINGKFFRDEINKEVIWEST